MSLHVSDIAQETLLSKKLSESHISTESHDVDSYADTLKRRQPLHRCSTELLHIMLVSAQDDLQRHEGQLLHARQAIVDAIEHIAMLDTLIHDTASQTADTCDVRYTVSCRNIFVQARADRNAMLSQLYFAEKASLSAVGRDYHEIKNIEGVLDYREAVGADLDLAEDMGDSEFEGYVETHKSVTELVTELLHRI